MLTIRELTKLPVRELKVVGGAKGLGREVAWVHISELSDPTPWLEGGELLLTVGLGIGPTEASQRTYIRKLVAYGVAGLGFGIGSGFDEVPPALIKAADEADFPLIRVPVDIPFIAITKVAFTRIGSQQLEVLTQALDVHERLTRAILDGRDLRTLLGILGEHLGCSLAVVDEDGRVMSELHAGSKLPFTEPYELPLGVRGASLQAVRTGRPFGEYDRLVMHHGQTALAFELSRRLAVSATEIRLAGDLIDDLELGRLDERAIARRVAAFGLDPQGDCVAIMAMPALNMSIERLRVAVNRELRARSIPHISAYRTGALIFIIEARPAQAVLDICQAVASNEDGARLAFGRPARGRNLERSLVEARTALKATAMAVSSYRDLGSLDLLLSLPPVQLEAFIERVLGPATHKPHLVASLTALLDSGCRWPEAAKQLGVHRHTLRYRMEQVRELSGRHPSDPSARMELWLAVKAKLALEAQNTEQLTQPLAQNGGSVGGK